MPLTPTGIKDLAREIASLKQGGERVKVWLTADECDAIVDALGQYDNLLTSWAECRELLSKERAITAKLVGALREIETYSNDMVAINAAHVAISDCLLEIPLSQTSSANDKEGCGCNHWPGQKRCDVCGMGSPVVPSQDWGAS